jgi:indolepyruvate ferredoxin oxidoreductase beta subunit
MAAEYNIMLAGVGGQGLMLLSTIFGNACNRLNKKVITGEQHGLSQRSGSIYVHLRIGERNLSPLIPYGSADLIISMEATEVLRYIEFLRDDGIIVMNSHVMHPSLVTGEIARQRDENRKYVTLEQIVKQLKQVTKNIITLDATKLAELAGNPRTENTVLSGAASALPEFPIDKETLRATIKELVPPKTIEDNLRAFDLGYEEAKRILANI